MNTNTKTKREDSEPPTSFTTLSLSLGTKRKRKVATVTSIKKNKVEYEPQGLDILKQNVLFSSTPLGEIVAPQALIDAAKLLGMSRQDVFRCGRYDKRWSLELVRLYLKIFPRTITNLESTCHHEQFLSQSEATSMLGFCDGLTGLQKVRTPEPDGKMLERDTMWYSFVDTDGFSTVYRGGSCDYSRPKEVKPHQFKMDAPFADIRSAVQSLMNKIQTEFGENPNHCVITRYNRKYDGINQHMDKTKDLVRGSSIFVFTFGAAKTFKVSHYRHNKPSTTVLEFKPASGSLIYMPWDMNQVFEHGIKFDCTKASIRRKNADFDETREERADFTEPRYSITFRSKCTWYNPETNKSYIDKQVQYSSMQPGGAVCTILTK